MSQQKTTKEVYLQTSSFGSGNLWMLAIGLGVIAILVALAGVYLEHRSSKHADKILKDIRRSEINEKTAMLYEYARGLNLSNGRVDHYLFKRMLADMNAMLAIKEVIKNGENDTLENELRVAGNALFKEMENRAETGQIEELKGIFQRLF